MKKAILLLIFPLLLTGCSSLVESNNNNSPIKEETPITDIAITEPIEETIPEEHNDEVEEVEVVEEIVEEPVIVDEPIEVIEEETIVETPIEEEVVSDDPVEEETSLSAYEDHPVYNEYGEYISPVYRAGGVTEASTIHIDVRRTEATITDSGRVNQKMDIVFLDYNYAGLENLGYHWLDVKVTLTAREVNDGYQYLFLYNTSKCQSVGESLLENFFPCAGDGIKQGMLFKEQFELGPGYKQTSWETRDFHFYVYVGNMIDNLYLRYGANGFLADTWINKNVEVSITPKKTIN